MTDVAIARDGRLPIAEPSNRGDCEAADVMGLRIGPSQRGASPPSRKRRLQHCRGYTRPGGRRSAADPGVMILSHSEVFPSQLGRRLSALGPRLWGRHSLGVLWDDPLEIPSEWYSSTTPIAANYLTSRRPATT